MPNQPRHRRARSKTRKITVILFPEEIAAINEMRLQTGLSFDRQMNRVWRQQLMLELGR